SLPDGTILRFFTPIPLQLEKPHMAVWWPAAGTRLPWPCALLWITVSLRWRAQVHRAWMSFDG
ncbi:MAG: hypothetical protein R6W71_09850, partial [Bacteroidales bacterium]